MVLADRGRGELEQDELVAPGAPQHEITPTRGTLDQHFVHPPDPAGILAPGDLAHPLDEPVEPVGRHLVRDVAGQANGWRAVPDRILERIRVVEIGLVLFVLWFLS